MTYLSHIVVLIGIAAMLAMSYNLLAGYTGLLSICHAAFYGLGAYTSALLTLKLNFPFPVSLLCAVLACSLAGLAVGWPSLRTRGEDFVIATFAFQVLFLSFLENTVQLTGGPMGLSAIAPLPFLGIRLATPLHFTFVAVALGFALLWLTAIATNSSAGRVVKGIREDEVFTASAGKDVAAFRVRVFVVSAGLAAIPGAIHAHYIAFIDPSSFTVMESIFVISIVILGGAGSLWGPVLGAVVLVALPELLRFVGIPSAVAANIRQILYGLALVSCMLWRPQGLIGEYAFGREAKQK